MGATAAALALLSAIIVLAGCSVRANGPSTHATSNADPGNGKLAQLRSDAVFSLLPPGASTEGPLVATPARHRPAGLDGGGDDGPSVSVKLVSTQPPVMVFAFYAQLAASSGWTATGQDAAGQANSWTKRYTGELHATLLLIDLDQRVTTAGAQHRYTLNCGGSAGA